MKAAVMAAAAAVLANGVSAARVHGHRHAHALFKRGDTGEVCTPGCTTIYSTITGEPTRYHDAVLPPAPTPTTTAAPEPTTTSGPVLVPTPIQQTCPTPGTYTIPATTVVLTETTTVCGASSTEVPSGTHTLGGVTTVVETATTVVCPVATTETQNGVVTSVIKTTTYVCPSAGTYTIAPITTVVPSVTTVVVPVVETYCPGTYTAPELVTTVTETSVIVTCPFTSVTPAEPTSAPVPTSEPAEPTSAPAPTSEPAEPAPAPPSSSSKVAPSPSPSPSSPSKGPNPDNNGKRWAMTYTPYAETAEGGCKSASEVMDDVAAIAKAGFKALRVYSTDCDTLPNVGAAARAHGLRLIVGIFIGKVGCDNNSPDVADQISALKEWKEWDLVDLCVVGNEALFNGFCSVSELASLIGRVKSELGSVGYNGPFTTTDVVAAWTNNDVSAICDAIDVTATNAHAYFNADTEPADAGKFVAGQLAIVEKVCGKPGYVMETGWPSAGNCNGVACAGEAEQATAIHSIEQELGNKAVFFSFRNDPWKQPGECNCEQHWGCANVFGV
ncbi:glycoside hydrolase family 17 protein [Thermothelomyces thermophilus ATCC 42464]|uniref:Probable beta-glucosidase btgE n=1 Tax=Thermothelomyces thermophilus (strain ATCC 42464 / BCRC 31852 / DSM 1799) TaxID=573729 RepID=G2Q1G7_THET4|nr:glycoside hydrolase family 17 protein [Thermothelomyces thermophilus ATCC 42464]AEO54157.1 glycoside hydrolase family 17 protein [Thermothelomyces thermophilus ATCC 42464]